MGRNVRSYLDASFSFTGKCLIIADTIAISQHLHRSYYVPSSVLSALTILIHPIFTAAL